MTRYVDRQAGFAAFRQGRSFCLRLVGTLDMAMAGGARDQIRTDAGSVRLRLECSTLSDADPEAVQLLAHALLSWSRACPGRSLHVLNLSPALRRRVAWHPLRAFPDPDELPFIDPDRDEVWNTTPSRH